MKKKLSVGLIILVVLNLALFATGYEFLFSAILHNFPDIDDYKIFENRKIKKSKHPQPWYLSSRYNKVEPDSDFRNYLEDLGTVAFLVIKNDSIVYEEYWDGYSDHSLSNSFSMAKSYVGALTGIALKEGYIKSVDEPVSHYIPEFKEGARRKITFKDLLTMSSGLSWKESYINPFSVTTEGYYGDDLKKVILGLESVESPGEKFEYRSGDTEVLALALTNATGKTLSKFLEEKLWRPTGAEQTALWSIDHKDGIEKAYCCINSNARDFARIGKLYMNKGNWNGFQILDSAYIEASITPADEIDKETGKKVDFYGYAWWIIPEYRGTKIFYARGILGQYVLVIPEKNIIVVRLGEKKGKKRDHHYEDVFRILDQALDKF